VPDTTRVIAGSCTATFEDDDHDRDRRQYGALVVLVKPDGTVLAHDAAGYQPVAWLTRPDAVTVDDDRVTATDGDQRLRVDFHDTRTATHPTSDAGPPVGDCPDCDDRLVRARGALACPDCDARYPLPDGAAVTDEQCPDCALPRVRVERGASFVVCPDRGCDPLDDRVRAAFDGAWSCRCGGDLRVRRRRTLVLACGECSASYAVPDGTHDDDCGCGLPAFETAAGRRCLDTTCRRC
jgi:DNA topoisomerase-1